MATAARSLSRVALSIARQATPKTRLAVSSYQIPQRCSRPLSTTPQVAYADRNRDPEENVGYDPSLEPEVVQVLEKLDSEMNVDVDSELYELDKSDPLILDTPKPAKLGYWGEDEDIDDEAARSEDLDDTAQNDGITSMAHTELEQHRELRAYARTIAWDMPSLTALTKPFSIPSKTQILRFRYTTYMGESHPAESKVVLEFSSKDLVPTYLTMDQRMTLLKLVGPRYNPDKDIIRMSCEKFPTRAQNKRYLGDLVGKLLKEAKEGDSFADIPLDLRHHTSKPKLKYPKSWYMTEERKQWLESSRQGMKKLELESPVVDGNEAVSIAAQALPALSKIGSNASRQPVGVPAGRGKPQNKGRPRGRIQS